MKGLFLTAAVLTLGVVGEANANEAVDANENADANEEVVYAADEIMPCGNAKAGEFDKENELKWCDKQGALLNGKSEEKYEGGALRAERQYVNGQKEGLERGYYEPSSPEDKGERLKYEINYRQGKPVIRKEYFENGSIRFIVNFETGKSEMYKANGELNWERDNKDGKDEVVPTAAAANADAGKSATPVEATAEVAGSTAVGENVASPVPSVAAESAVEPVAEKPREPAKIADFAPAPAAKDENNGFFKHYYDDGSLMEEVTYKDGREDGIRKMYKLGGKLWLETTFRDGVQEGVQKEYDEVGSLVLETNYTDGYLNGTARGYKKGKIALEVAFEKGHPVSGASYDEEGNKTEISVEDLAKFINGITKNDIDKYTAKNK